LSHDHLFPAVCLSALPQLTNLIDAGSTPQRSYGSALSSADGKDLTCILYVAALAKRASLNPDKGTARSWFGWVDKQKKVDPVMKQIDMHSSQSYRHSTI
jgi:hypothetical protein